MAEMIMGVASIIAILVSPIVALQVQKLLDEHRDARNRKLTIFKNLMMYVSRRCRLASCSL